MFYICSDVVFSEAARIVSPAVRQAAAPTRRSLRALPADNARMVLFCSRPELLSCGTSGRHVSLET